MERPKVSTNVGLWSIFGGFLNVFSNVRVENFFEVFSNLTFGALAAMLIPFVAGIVSIIHKEKV